MKVLVGSSDFRKIREMGYYYVDKTALIEKILSKKESEVRLITRPRRFGKTLGMRMMAEFFDIQKDSRGIFEGLAIMKNTSLCKEWMNRYPTLFVSFKDVDGDSFENAYGMLALLMMELCNQHLYLLDSDKLSLADRERFDRLSRKHASPDEIKGGIVFLMRLMRQHFHKKVIFLLDEYDVPLAKAGSGGYYSQMLEVIRMVLSKSLKDNVDLQLAVVTGCLRIAKESIFTGANHFITDTILDRSTDEHFGFTKAEVEQILSDVNLREKSEVLREWYDGYVFGDMEIYCPWDVMNYIGDLLEDPMSHPKNYWANSSDNAIIRTFLEQEQFDVGDKFEILLEGGSIRERIEEDLTYDRIYTAQENFWSVLYMAGYLTKVRELESFDSNYFLKIPNAEIMTLFKGMVRNWLVRHMATKNRGNFFKALWQGDEEELTNIISELLFDTISYHDYRESFYHAFLTGLMSEAGYAVKSNYEYGLGRSDIVVKNRKTRSAVVIEAKIAEKAEQMEKGCNEALLQIQNRQYARQLEREGFRNIICYGVSFFQKQCLAKAAR